MHGSLLLVALAALVPLTSVTDVAAETPPALRLELRWRQPATADELLWELVGELDAGAGLALWCADLVGADGPPEPARLPDDDRIAAAFTPPAGVTNPEGYGGRPAGDRLLQMGGAQATWGSSDIDQGAGPVVPGLAAPGEPTVLALGRMPRAAGRGARELRLENVLANALVSAHEAGAWTVVPARVLPVAPLPFPGPGTPPADAPVVRPVAAPPPPFQPRMGEPLGGLTPDELSLFETGRERFGVRFEEADGLGPAFNDDSCVACHKDPAPGGFARRTVKRFGRAGPPFDPLVEKGGPLLQFQFTTPVSEEFIPPESDVQALRLTPHLFGAGLVEAIPDDVLVALAPEQPAELRGRVHRVQLLERDEQRVGRFGWKCQIATLLTFSADAALMEMGITNRLLPDETVPNGDEDALRRADTTPDPESGTGARPHDIDHFTDFQRFLAPPPQTPPSGMTGEAVFERLGCAACHVPRLATGPSASAALSGVTLRPYSDFLLHDMGALGDGIADGDATETELRTMPLWGLGQRAAFLHDGKSTGGTFGENVLDAIARHDGQGAPAARAAAGMSPAERDALVGFLRSLGRAAFDEDNDNDVDAGDWQRLRGLVTGPRGRVTPDDPGALADADADGDVDLVDISVLQRAQTGPGGRP